MVRPLLTCIGILGLICVTRADTATARVGATIVAAASVQASATLSWGDFSPGPAGGLVTLAPGGTRMLRGDLVARGGPLRAACLRLTTPPDAACTLQLPAAVTLHGPPGTAPLTADSFRVQADRPGLSGPATAVVYIGATAHIAPNQAPGVYCGDLPVFLSCH